MKTMVLIVFAGLAGLPVLFRSKVLSQLLGKHSIHHLKYPHLNR